MQWALGVGSRRIENHPKKGEKLETDRFEN
jgi:hypothetical protein